MITQAMDLAVLTLAFTSTLTLIDGTRIQQKSVGAVRRSESADQFSSSSVKESFGRLFRDLALVSLLDFSADAAASPGGGWFGALLSSRKGVPQPDKLAPNELLKFMESKMSPLMTTDTNMPRIINEAVEVSAFIDDMVRNVMGEIKKVIGDGANPYESYNLARHSDGTQAVIKWARSLVKQGDTKSKVPVELMAPWVTGSLLKLLTSNQKVNQFLKRFPEDYREEAARFLLAKVLHEKKELAGKALDQYAKAHSDIISPEGYAEFKVQWIRKTKASPGSFRMGFRMGFNLPEKLPRKGVSAGSYPVDSLASDIPSHVG